MQIQVIIGKTDMLQQKIVKLMDNLSLQVTPVEVSCKAKTPLQLTCLLKKVSIQTGHVLQKQELRSHTNPSSSNHSFPQGPTFNLTKQFETRNTKISLHFMNRREKNVTCIGSTELDVATLPLQPYSLIECPLSNSLYPHSTARIEVRRVELKSQPTKHPRAKPQEVALLGTEGQRKEEWLLGRRNHPNIPTAYEISRKNFKKVEVVRDSSGQSQSRKTTSKGSYRQRFKHFTAKEVKRQSPEDLPTPRKRTPEPIAVIRRGKMEPEKEAAYHSGSNINQTTSSLQTSKNTRHAEIRKEPSSSKRNLEHIHIQNISISPKQTYPKSFEHKNHSSILDGSENEYARNEQFHHQQSDNRYESITEKLQLIQEQLLGSQLTQPHPSQPLTADPKTQLSAGITQESIFQRKSHLEMQWLEPVRYEKEGPLPKREAVLSYNCQVSNFTAGSPYSQQSHTSPSPDRPQRDALDSVNIQPAIRIKSHESWGTDQEWTLSQLKKELEQLSVLNQRLTDQNSSLNQQLIFSEEVGKKFKLQLYRSQTEQNAMKGEVQSLQIRLHESQNRNLEQQNLLASITESYEKKVEEVFDLSSKLSQIKPKDTPSRQLQDSSSLSKTEVQEAELKCYDLEEELRLKKGALTEVVNTMWKYGSPQLMQSIASYMEE